jgi:HAUS augmin-like complex subunit 2
MVSFIYLKEMLRPIPAALASCTRFFEAMSAMRESFSTLQALRVGHSSLSMTPGGASDDSKFLTPPQWREGSMLNSWKQVDDVNPESDGLDGMNQRRLSWPSSMNRDL